MDDVEWFRMIDKICDEKGVNFPVEGYHNFKRKYVGCGELRDEMLKRNPEIEKCWRNKNGM